MRIFTPIAVSVAIILSAAPVILARQSPAASQEATCAITGRVTIENEAAFGVVVILQRATSSWPLPPPIARATADKEGRFQMSNLPEGRYYLIPLAPAYFAPSEDRMIASGKPVTLTKGETFEGIELKLIPGGVITGRVTTAGGQPVIGATVYTRADPRAMQQLPATSYSDSRFKTDDRGVYRVYGLPASRYIVSADSGTPGQPGSVFHPGVTEASQAAPVDVLAGQVVENVNIKLPPIARVYEASGRVIDEATGQPISGISVGRSLLEANSNRAVAYSGGYPVDEHGVFRFTDLAPGHHSVSVAINSGSEYYSDEVVFEVTNQDVTGLEIRARRAASLSGVVIIEGAREPSVLPDLSHIHISVYRLAGGMGFGARVNKEGRFRIPGLPPDKFRIQVSSSAQGQRFSLLWKSDFINRRREFAGAITCVSGSGGTRFG